VWCIFSFFNFSEEIKGEGFFFSFVLEDDARWRYNSAMIGLDVHDLDVRDFDVHEVGVHEVDVHEVDVRELDVHDLDVHDLGVHELGGRDLDALELDDLDVQTDAAVEIQLQRLPLD